MLRFSYGKIEDNNIANINKNVLYMDNNIWNDCKRFLLESDKESTHVMNMIPVMNASEELITYGYQDGEADRELRMLKELSGNEHALQFTDIFPEYQKVTIYGCNELAVSFAEYLKTLGVSISVIGKFWDYFGYETDNEGCLLGGDTDFIVYAEGIPMHNQDLRYKTQQSVSPEFECIDKIYEKNVLEGKICDTIGDLDDFIRILKCESEIVILGSGREAQDAYDLLMSHEIDISCFAVGAEVDTKLLGKDVITIAYAMEHFQHPVFLNCRDTQGALGGIETEFFDYRGYERNKQFFLVRDYTDIPTSNLVHVLHEKKVLLTGDPRLCELLSDYLDSVENGEVDVRYIALSEKVSEREDSILCLVLPDLIARGDEYISPETERNLILRETLSEMGFTNYSPYFTCFRSFALIDIYLNRNNEKYTVPELTPKGILIGRIPAWNGNIFLRGILDGHPEVLLIPYSFFNTNLFYYCIYLAGIDSDKVMQNFWKMYDEEVGSRELDFPNQSAFEERMTSLLRLKNSFTSQELFVLFHIAYAEMINHKPISDISDMIIYWEPHLLDRNQFPFFALWLEDAKINGHTLVVRRNHIVKTGSLIHKRRRNHPFSVMFLRASAYDGFNLIKYSHWTEFKLRFEEIKVQPQKELIKLCKLMNIEWSDNMLRTTIAGKPYDYLGVVDYDLHPVFTEYAEALSAFDRFRISIASSLSQKRYGYTYYDCTKFSRRELRDMFYKPFLVEEQNQFKGELQNMDNFYEWINWELWEIRKHMVLNDIEPEFPYFEL